MRYTTATYALHAKRDEDIGIDLPSLYDNLIPPRSWLVIETGVRFEFPIWCKLRRWLYKIVLGVEVVGVAGIIKPRSRHNTLVMAGVVDAGYRGTIKVKLYNPSNNDVFIRAGDRIAQLVPLLSINAQPVLSDSIRANTGRGEAGGINAVR